MTPTTAYSYRATVLRWVDADTLDVRIDLGLDVSINQRVRLYGVNAPEMHSANPADRTAAKAALALSESLAPAGSPVQLRTHKSNDKFGRYLAGVTNAAGDDVALALIGAGLAVEYFGGAR